MGTISRTFHTLRKSQSPLNGSTRTRSSTCPGFRAPSVPVEAPQQVRSAQGPAPDSAATRGDGVYTSPASGSTLLIVSVSRLVPAHEFKPDCCTPGLGLRYLGGVNE